MDGNVNPEESALLTVEGQGTLEMEES